MSSKAKTFVALCLAGEVGPEAIDDFVRKWHTGKSETSLAEYLGFTEEEYACWVEEPWTLRLIMYARVHNTALNEVLPWGEAQNIAARAGTPEEGEVLRKWLVRTGRI